MKFTRTELLIIFILLFVAALAASIAFIGRNEKTNNAYKLTGNTIVDGKNLVQLKCTGCHNLVPPDALSKVVWQNHTLPSMAKYLNISTYGGNQYFKKNPLDTTGISLQNWLAIVAYYEKTAPVALPAAKPPVPLLNDWTGFSIKKPDTVKDVVFTTMVSVNPSSHKIYTSDLQTAKLLEWDKNLKPRTVAQLPSAGAGASFIKDTQGNEQGIISCIGQILQMDFPDGKVVSVDIDSKKSVAEPKTIQTDLARPVQTLSGDFDKDGLTDWVICAQGGNKTGGVYLLKQNTDHTFTQSSISDKPGAVQAVVSDFNNDGWPDIMVLFGSGDEGLWLFTNDHNGKFTAKNLLHFPPTYGSTSFQLADINHDGKPDLIYTCGYNYRDSQILKPYHGLYIFTNQGNWQFRQSYFYPIDGCTKAIAADFDGDGDLDIATIAFFADLKNNPSEGFVYFEQDKTLSFKPHAVPISKYGRWMSMDVSDINGDGKPDIVLGNYSTGFIIQEGLKPFWNKHLPLIVLENHTKK